MARDAIVEKLKVFLIEQPLTTEPQATYLMVELRKILDHAYDKKEDFTILRFYSDWTVHTAKERSLENIRPIIEAMYESAKKQIEEPHLAPFGKTPVVDFIYLEELKAEMLTLFRTESLPEEIFEKTNWVAFVQLLVNILMGQPIVSPTKDVTSFVFMEAAPGCIRGRMDFAVPLSNKEGTYQYYQFGNVY